jgi:hypothetical protein
MKVRGRPPLATVATLTTGLDPPRVPAAAYTSGLRAPERVETSKLGKSKGWPVKVTVQRLAWLPGVKS